MEDGDTDTSRDLNNRVIQSYYTQRVIRTLILIWEASADFRGWEHNVQLDPILFQCSIA